MVKLGFVILNSALFRDVYAYCHTLKPGNQKNTIRTEVLGRPRNLGMEKGDSKDVESSDFFDYNWTCKL